MTQRSNLFVFNELNEHEEGFTLTGRTQLRIKLPLPVLFTGISLMDLKSHDSPHFAQILETL